MSISISLPGLEKQLKNLKGIDMRKIGAKAFELNSDQLQKFKDNKDKRFKQYTRAYATRKGVARTAVDLTGRARTQPKKNKKPFGTMRLSFGVLGVRPNKVLIAPSGSWNRAKARFIVSGGSSNKQSKARLWIGLTKIHRKELINFSFKILKKGTF